MLILVSVYLLLDSKYSQVSTVRPLDPCDVPLSRLKSWSDGVVTVVQPAVERNCTNIIAGDQEEIKNVRNRSLEWKNRLTNEELLEMTKNCSWVRDYFHGNLYTTKLEISFPMAYTLVVHDSPQQVIRLLKLLYRPTNTYCFHTDKKSTPVFTNIFQNIAGCLKDNIFITNSVDVHWGYSSVLDAQMSCLTDLVHQRSGQPENKQWKYVINLCGKELPLTSTNGIVSHLNKLNGSSVIRAEKVRPNDKYTRRRLHNKTIPFNLPMYKSSTYMALSYKFANFIVTNSTAIKINDFFRKCSNPEEHYYATLFMMPGVPGGFDPNLPESLYVRIEKALWVYSMKKGACKGKQRHSVCLVTVNELEGVLKASKNGVTAFFHNKYFMEQDHTIMDCMEERLVATNRMEFKQECE